MEDRKLEQLKKEYLETPIPEELDSLVKKNLKESREHMKRKSIVKKTSIAAASVVIFVSLLTAGVNSSPILATTLLKIPVIGSIVEVLTFGEYTVSEDNFHANIKVPSIQGLGDKDLEDSLNEKYLTESKQLYEEFMIEMEDIRKNGQGNFAVESGYFVKTDTDKILSIGRYTLTVKASGEEKLKYDTIDKQNELLITLPSLFKDNSYVEIISENIRNQMKEQINIEEGIIYWVEDGEFIDAFDKISENQNFYISKEGKLVISFNEYEVAPGSMGIVEFIIPTEIIAYVLVSDEYIK
ncbi:MAG: DUF3298 domain-containing protein [Desulfitobacteriaceae bacterium]|nr:DUF3298 domain-containing protein [Desulfitobacteriaceae bacterium]MDD4346387.1 DUF3298 domain-containing protein [Desulfitobacteriaceae bacterium]MDD4400940.1 DUF3298 domain-containing protein [Desulfitobacteriaceae bacterium]